MRLPRLASLLLVSLTASCASTTTVKQAGSLADAGIAYGGAAQEVIALTRDRYFDWQSASLLEEIADRAHCTKAEVAGEGTMSTACAELIAEFDDENVSNQELVSQFADLSDHARALGQYFQALKTLAVYDSAGSAESAAGRLVDRINGLSNKLEEKAAITPAQKTTWGKLAGLVGDAVKASRIKSRLEADAASIGRAIDIQSGVLQANLAVLEGLDNAARLEAYEENVRAPYLVGAITDPARWRAQRREMLSPGPEIAQVKALRAASEALQEVWADILSGSGNPQSAAQVFEDIARTIKIIDDVRRAHATPTEG